MLGSENKTKRKSGGKGEILFFSFPIGKRWMSAILALIFLFNTCFPAWARDGNYGRTESFEAFTGGLLAGLVTGLGCYLNPAVGMYGSVTSDLVGLYMYYNYYHDYGRTMFTIFGIDISYGQFYSMVAGICAGAIVAYVQAMQTAAAQLVATEAATSEATKQAVEAAAKAAAEAAIKEAAAKGITGEACKKMIEEAIKKATEAAIRDAINAALKEAGKKLSGQAIDKIVEDAIAKQTIVKQIVDAAISSTAQSGAKATASTVVKQSLLAKIKSFFTRIFDYITHPVKYAKKYLEKLKANRIAAETGIDGRKLTVREQIARELAKPLPSPYWYYGAHRMPEKALVHLLGDITIGTLRLVASEGLKQRLENRGWDETIAAVAGEVAGLYTGTFFTPIILRAYGAPFGWKAIGNNGTFLNEEDAQKIKQIVELGREKVEVTYTDEQGEHKVSYTVEELARATRGSAMVVEGKIVNLSPQALAEILAGTDPTATDLDRTISVSFEDGSSKEMKVSEFRQSLSIIEVLNIDGALIKNVDVKSLTQNVGTRLSDYEAQLRTPWNQYLLTGIGGFMNDVHGNPLTGYPLLRSGTGYPLLRSGWEAVRNLGLSPLISGLVKVYALRALGYTTHHGHDRERIFENLKIMALADLISGFAGSAINEWDALNSRFAGTRGRKKEGIGSKNLWSRRGDMSVEQYLGRELVSEIGGALSAIAWARYCKNNDIQPGAAAELMHLVRSTLASSLIDAFFRRDPGKAGQTVLILKKKNADGVIETREEPIENIPSGVLDKILREPQTEPVQIPLQGTMWTYYGNYRERQIPTDKKDFYLLGRLSLTWGSVGRFGRSWVENLNNYLGRASLGASLSFDPGRPTTGLNAFQAQWQVQAKFIQHIDAMMRGANPIQATANRVSSQLNFWANQDFAESFSAAIANRFLPLKDRSYATFIPTYQRLADEVERSKRELEQRKREKEEVSSVDTKAAGEVSVSYEVEPGATLFVPCYGEITIISVTEGLFNTVEVTFSYREPGSDTPKEQTTLLNFLAILMGGRAGEPKPRPPEIPAQLHLGDVFPFTRAPSLDHVYIIDMAYRIAAGTTIVTPDGKTIVVNAVTNETNPERRISYSVRGETGGETRYTGLTGLAGLVGGRSEVADRERKEIILRRAHEAGLISGDSRYRSPQDVEEQIRGLDRARLLMYLYSEIASLDTQRSQLQDAASLLKKTGWIPVLGVLPQVAVLSQLARSSRGYVNLNDIFIGGIIDYRVDRRIESSPVPIDETLRGIFRRFAKHEHLSGEDERILSKIIEMMESEELRREMSQRVFSTYYPAVVGIPQAHETYGQAKLVDAQMRVIRDRLYLAIREGQVRSLSDIEKLEFWRERAPWLHEGLEGNIDGLSDRELLEGVGGVGGVEGNISLLISGPIIYHPEISLLQRTRVDDFGRMIESTYYGQEYNAAAGKWEQVRLPRTTRYYYGPFGLALAKTQDYSQIGVPLVWPHKPQATIRTPAHDVILPTEPVGIALGDLIDNVRVYQERIISAVEEIKEKTGIEILLPDIGQIGDLGALKRWWDVVREVASQWNTSSLEAYRLSLQVVTEQALESGILADGFRISSEGWKAKTREELIQIAGQLRQAFTGAKGVGVETQPISPIPGGGSVSIPPTTEPLAAPFGAYITPHRRRIPVKDSPQAGLIDKAAGQLIETGSMNYFGISVEAHPFTQGEVSPYIESLRNNTQLIRELEALAGELWHIRTRVRLNLNTVWGAILAYMVASKSPDGRTWSQLSRPEKLALMRGTTGWRLLIYDLLARDGVRQKQPDHHSTGYFHRGSQADDVDFRRVPKIYLPVLETPGISVPLPSFVSPAGVETTTTTTLIPAVYYPVSTGPNTTYDLNLYSTGQGVTPYAGPSYRLMFRDINSGPYLQAGAHYTVRIQDILGRQRHGAQETFIDDLRRMVLMGEDVAGYGDRQQLFLREYFQEFVQGERKKEQETEDSYEDLFGAGREWPFAEESELFPSLEESELFPFLTEGRRWWQVEPRSEEELFAQWLSDNEGPFLKLFEDSERGQSLHWPTIQSLQRAEQVQKDLGAYLARDLSGVQELLLFRYQDIAGRTYSLPTWSTRVGYGLEPNLSEALRFSQAQGYTYDIEEIKGSISGEYERAGARRNTLFRNLLRGVRIYSLGGYGFTRERPLDDEYGAFFNYFTQVHIPEEYAGVRELIGAEVIEQGIGSDAVISVIDAPEARRVELQLGGSGQPEAPTPTTTPERVRGIEGVGSATTAPPAPATTTTATTRVVQPAAGLAATTQSPTDSSIGLAGADIQRPAGQARAEDLQQRQRAIAIASKAVQDNPQFQNREDAINFAQQNPEVVEKALATYTPERRAQARAFLGMRPSAPEPAAAVKPDLNPAAPEPAVGTSAQPAAATQTITPLTGYGQVLGLGTVAPVDWNQAVGDAQVVFLGDIHGSQIGTFIGDNLSALREQGVTSLGLETIHSGLQPELDRWNDDDKEKVREYLGGLWSNYGSQYIENLMNLIQSAKDNGMRVVGIENPNASRTVEGDRNVVNLYWADIIASQVNAGRMAIFCGGGHFGWGAAAVNTLLNSRGITTSNVRFFGSGTTFYGNLEYSSALPGYEGGLDESTTFMVRREDPSDNSWYINLPGEAQSTLASTAVKPDLNPAVSLTPTTTPAAAPDLKPVSPPDEPMTVETKPVASSAGLVMSPPPLPEPSAPNIININGRNFAFHKPTSDPQRNWYKRGNQFIKVDNRGKVLDRIVLSPQDPRYNQDNVDMANDFDGLRREVAGGKVTEINMPGIKVGVFSSPSSRSHNDNVESARRLVASTVAALGPEEARKALDGANIYFTGRDEPDTAAIVHPYLKEIAMFTGADDFPVHVLAHEIAGHIYYIQGLTPEQREEFRALVKRILPDAKVQSEVPSSKVDPSEVFADVSATMLLDAKVPPTNLDLRTVATTVAGQSIPETTLVPIYPSSQYWELNNFMQTIFNNEAPPQEAETQVDLQLVVERVLAPTKKDSNIGTESSAPQKTVNTLPKRTTLSKEIEGTTPKVNFEVAQSKDGQWYNVRYIDGKRDKSFLITPDKYERFHIEAPSSDLPIKGVAKSTLAEAVQPSLPAAASVPIGQDQPSVESKEVSYIIPGMPGSPPSKDIPKEERVRMELASLQTTSRGRPLDPKAIRREIEKSVKQSLSALQEGDVEIKDLLKEFNSQGQLDKIKKDLAKGKISPEQAITSIHSLIYRQAGIKYELSAYELDYILAEDKANCVGYTKLFYVLGRAVGLDVGAIGMQIVLPQGEYEQFMNEVEEARSKKPPPPREPSSGRDLSFRLSFPEAFRSDGTVVDSIHEANFVRLNDGKIILVDLVRPEGPRISKPFSLSEMFRKEVEAKRLYLPTEESRSNLSPSLPFYSYKGRDSRKDFSQWPYPIAGIEIWLGSAPEKKSPDSTQRINSIVRVPTPKQQSPTAASMPKKKVALEIPKPTVRGSGPTVYRPFFGTEKLSAPGTIGEQKIDSTKPFVIGLYHELKPGVSSLGLSFENTSSKPQSFRLKIGTALHTNPCEAGVRADRDFLGGGESVRVIIQGKNGSRRSIVDSSSPITLGPYETATVVTSKPNGAANATVVSGLYEFIPLDKNSSGDPKITVRAQALDATTQQIEKNPSLLRKGEATKKLPLNFSTHTNTVRSVPAPAPLSKKIQFKERFNTSTSYPDLYVFDPAQSTFSFDQKNEFLIPVHNDSGVPMEVTFRLETRGGPATLLIDGKRINITLHEHYVPNESIAEIRKIALKPGESKNVTFNTTIVSGSNGPIRLWMTSRAVNTVK